jgi:hypothetical protein
MSLCSVADCSTLAAPSHSCKRDSTGIGKAPVRLRDIGKSLDMYLPTCVVVGLSCLVSATQQLQFPRLDS